MPRDICIVGILVENRARTAPEVQQVITAYGSNIISRCGIPDPTKSRGIITLTMEVFNNEADALVRELEQLDGVTAKALCLVEALE